MKAQQADNIELYLCDECPYIHIRLFKDGHMIAEAIPDDIEGFAAHLIETIETRDRELETPEGSSH